MEYEVQGEGAYIHYIKSDIILLLNIEMMIVNYYEVGT